MTFIFQNYLKVHYIAIRVRLRFLHPVVSTYSLKSSDLIVIKNDGVSTRVHIKFLKQRINATRQEFPCLVRLSVAFMI
ncbi:hypothetical protein ALC57_14992 [Trachymyrmex cornetzi]|uniref:Uncharacterized protein n=1 Tax=Trachymyrmex cornetzi TaxID=471704 RepID=A0A195DJD4_9HYME|nr:hypothetical protein ALC57_14992 [Trachymyrmex cornetzi]